MAKLNGSVSTNNPNAYKFNLTDDSFIGNQQNVDFGNGVYGDISIPGNKIDSADVNFYGENGAGDGTFKLPDGFKPTLHGGLLSSGVGLYAEDGWNGNTQPLAAPSQQIIDRNKLLYDRATADKTLDWTAYPKKLIAQPMLDDKGNSLDAPENYSDEFYTGLNDYYAKKDADPNSDTYAVAQAKKAKQESDAQAHQALVKAALANGFAGNIEATDDAMLKSFNDKFTLSANNPALQKNYNDTYGKIRNYDTQGIKLDDSSALAIDNVLRKFQAGTGSQSDLDALNAYLPQYESVAAKKAQGEMDAKVAAESAATEAKIAAESAARKSDNAVKMSGLLGEALKSVKNSATDPTITGGYDTNQNAKLTTTIDASALDKKNASTVDVNSIPQVNYDNVSPTLAQDKLTGMLFQNSKFLQDARNRGMRQANTRGLLNSSIAAGLAEEAAIAAAAPIAQFDAQLETDAARQNADGALKAGMFNAGNDLTAKQFNATQQQDFDKFGVKLLVDAKTQEAAWDVSGMQAKYAAAVQEGRDKYSAITDMTKLFSAQNFELNKASTQTMFDMLRDDNSAAAQKTRDEILDKYAKENQVLADTGAMERTIYTTDSQFNNALLDRELEKQKVTLSATSPVVSDLIKQVMGVLTTGDMSGEAKANAVAQAYQMAGDFIPLILATSEGKISDWVMDAPATPTPKTAVEEKPKEETKPTASNTPAAFSTPYAATSAGGGMFSPLLGARFS